MKQMSELKYANITAKVASQIAGPTAAVLGGLVNDLVPTIAQGPGKVGQRIGNMIQYKYLTVRFMMEMSSSANPITTPVTSFFVRVILFQKRLPLTQLNQVIDIGGTNDIDELRSPDVIIAPTINQNIRVLNDEVFIMNNLAVSQDFLGSNAPAVGAFTWRHKINNRVSFRAAADTTPTDPTDQYGFVALIRGIAPQVNASDHNKVLLLINAWAKITYYDL